MIESDTAQAVTSPDDPLEVSVIVPAWNEAENIPLLVPKIADALQAGGLKS